MCCANTANIFPLYPILSHRSRLNTIRSQIFILFSRIKFSNEFRIDHRTATIYADSQLTKNIFMHIENTCMESKFLTQTLYKSHRIVSYGFVWYYFLNSPQFQFIVFCRVFFCFLVRCHLAALFGSVHQYAELYTNCVQMF